MFPFREKIGMETWVSSIVLFLFNVCDPPYVGLLASRIPTIRDDDEINIVDAFAYFLYQGLFGI
jgi:hypothetical protein